MMDKVDTDALTAQILGWFQEHSNMKVKPKRLRSFLNVPQRDYPELRDTLKNLARAGKLGRFQGNMYGLNSGTDLQVGILQIPAHGMPWVVTPEGERVTVDETQLRGAVHDDTVAIKLYPRPLRGQPDAQIRKIVKRGRNRVLASYQSLRGGDIAVPELSQLKFDIVLDDLGGTRPNTGDIIDVEITEWPTGTARPHGRILRIIGSREQVEYDALFIADQFHIPIEFSPESLKESRELKLRTGSKSRLDLRQETVFTIDPADAKDFDDAVSLKELDNGHVQLGVHIADVSEYVQRNSALDGDAYQRGTSVYFTRQVIPMLPEVLSNDLCSLKPDEDRLCVSVLFELDQNAELLSYSLHESLIHSCRRFSYEEVQAILDGEEGDHADVLLSMKAVAAKLFAKRRAWGSIDFDLPEPRYELDEQGNPVNIFKKDRLDSHRIIEEFMLLANRTVTEYMFSREAKLPFIFRIHDEPEAEDIRRLFRLMKGVGLEQPPPSGKIRPMVIQKALDSIQDHPAEKFIEKITLRSMMKARYSQKNRGHFGLAFKSYTHFTSPIRRYPDLIVHRILKSVIKTGTHGYSEEDLRIIANKSSETEVRAVEAEREYHRRKQLKFMSDRIGQKFHASVSGLLQSGLFVVIEENFVEGFVPRRELPGDYWDYDKENFELRGRRTRKIYRLGDALTVILARVDMNRGFIDFALAPPDES